ncbi:Component of oligomeric Golgi complex 7 [Pseudozyma hubeiensis]|nr:Component of oligomeric Golgi complex 7 [Pseudozyma hubeiensis]
MALSPSAAEQHGWSDNAGNAAARLEAIEALRSAHQPTQLAPWLDHYAAAIASDSASPKATTSKLDETAAAMRQLSLSLSSVRDASRIELDQIITSLVSTIPKIGIELRLMSDTATALQTRVQSLQAHTATKDTSTDVTLARIAALSKAKAGLIDARHALREAQAWSTLESQVTMLLSEERWQDAVERLAKATDSLHLFSGSAKSNEEKSQLLQILTQRIHERLSPMLRQAIVDRDGEEVARMAKLLASTQDGSRTFFRIYTDTRSQHLLSRWANTASESSQKPLQAQVTLLFGDLLALLGEERVASASLFTEPNRAMQLLTADVIVGLDPPIHACIQQATRASDLESFLAALTEAFKAAEEAARAIQSILPEAKTPQDGQQDDQSGSTKAPIDSHLLALKATDKPWLQLLFEPFLPYQTRLATFEAEAMQSRLQHLQSSDSAATNSVSIASTQSLQVARAALRRSTALTKSFATPSLLPSLDSLLETAMHRARHGLSADLKQALDDLQTRIRRQHLSENARQAALTYDERGEVLTSNDWNEFRTATDTLSTCRESLAAIRSLEEAIAYQISELGAVTNSPSPTTREADPTAIDYTSSTTALATSSLNTTMLHELISKCKRLLSTASWKSSATDTSLLPLARASVLSIATTIQSFQQDLVLSQFLPELELYPSLSIWTSNKHPSIVNEYDLAMPKFSLSPTEAMARIGEAMLNLPRLLEGYADEVLLFCLYEGKEEIKEKGSQEEAARLDEKSHARHATTVGGVTSASGAAERSSMHRQAFSTTVVPSDPSISNTGPAAEGDESEAGVLSQYLRSLLTLFLTRFLTTVLPSLPRLSEIGAAQLAADLDYLGNIASVIYAESEMMLRFWKKATELSGDEGRAVVAEYVVGVNGRNGSGLGQRKGGLEGWSDSQVEAMARSEAFRTVARLRGWI